MIKYYVGCNIPGHLSDCEPFKASSWGQAKDCLLMDLASELGEDDLTAEDRAIVHKAKRELRSTKKSEGTFLSDVMPSGYVHWIERG